MSHFICSTRYISSPKKHSFFYFRIKKKKSLVLKLLIDRKWSNNLSDCPKKIASRLGRVNKRVQRVELKNGKLAHSWEMLNPNTDSRDVSLYVPFSGRLNDRIVHQAITVRFALAPSNELPTDLHSDLTRSCKTCVIIPSPPLRIYLVWTELVVFAAFTRIPSQYPSVYRHVR